MIGNLIISLFAGVSTFVCLELVGVPFALPLAVTVALTDLIPMVGATLGAAICVLVALFTGGVWPTAIVVLLFFIAYQQLENYLIAPRVLRNTVNLSSVAVLIVALIGGTVLGLVGAVIAIPIAATFRVILSPLNDEPTPDESTVDTAPTDVSTAVGTSAVGTSAVGTSAVGTSAVGTSAVGTQAVGTSAVGTQAVGTSAVGTQAVGTPAVGTQAVGTSAVGTPADPVLPTSTVDSGEAGEPL
jgi:hypothetical protein